jgi:hypothetical protein
LTLTTSFHIHPIHYSWCICIDCLLVHTISLVTSLHVSASLCHPQVCYLR